MNNLTKAISIIVLIVTVSACSLTGPEYTPAQKAGYSEKIEYQQDHMPSLDRQLQIKNKLKISVCEGQKVRTFSVYSTWGMIVCSDGSYMRFSIDKMKIEY